MHHNALDMASDQLQTMNIMHPLSIHYNKYSIKETNKLSSLINSNSAFKTIESVYRLIQIYSGITCGRVLNGELYTQNLQKLIYLHIWIQAAAVPLSFHFTRRPVN